MSRLSPLDDPSARTLAAGDLEAVFLPSYGMLGASLRHRGTEVLGRVDDLDTAAAKGMTAGIPLLHPWANRLSGIVYRAAGREVGLDPSSPLLRFDDNGLPIHGVHWSRLAWGTTETARDRIGARLDWMRDDLLPLFPFPHRLEMTATLAADSLTLALTLMAGAAGPVPVSFGFHPFFALPGLPREKWRLELPAMRQLVLDPRGIPTGDEVPFDELDAQLGALDLDDGYRLLDQSAAFALSGGGRRITVELLVGYTYAQVFAPKDKDYIALEPMTAPVNALTTGGGLRVVAPGEAFHAVFRIGIASVP